MNSYLIRYLLRKPILILILATLSCCLVLFHQYYYEYSTYNNHIARLTRRNTSTLEYYHHDRVKKSSKIKDQQYSGGRNNMRDVRHSKSFSEIDDLMSRIEDLKKIKFSISNELRLIEREKGKLLKEKISLSNRNDKLLSQISKSKAQLKQLEFDISANRRRKFEQTCDIGRVSPILFNPLKSFYIEQSPPTNNESHSNKNVINEYTLLIHSKYSFDLSLCPLSDHFKFHLLKPPSFNDKIKTITDNHNSRIELTSVIDILQFHHYYTPNIDEACLLITLLDEHSQTLNLNASKNNLVINLSRNSTITGSKLINGALASFIFPSDTFRSQFDLVLPSIWKSSDSYESIVGSIPPQSPIDRKYLASYFGRSKKNEQTSPSEITSMNELSPLEKALQVIHRNSIDDLFLFIYNCGPDSNSQCFEEKEKMIELSTYLIIIPTVTSNGIDENTNDLVYLSLSRGSIPVIIGMEKIRLPFDEVIDWRRAAILLNTARLSEMHFILRSIGPSDLYQLKYYGRRIFENYLATAKQILDTTINVMSLQRFNYPPPPIQDVKTNKYHSEGNLMVDTNCTSNACLELKSDSLNGMLSSEILGPRERALASPAYRRNFSLVFNSAYNLWNDPMYSPSQLLPSYPVDPILPSEYKFISPDQGFRPIADGLGGSGYEFSRALGGDYPNEQFTIVLLTYEREAMLMKTLERLKGLAYLNKILIVWNGVRHKPTNDLIWPDVGVPLSLVKVNRNSLNNRFLPYDEIETDAILSLDDDSPLRPDEIVFAFRVWRQSRDRIVGFPGRYHAWDATQNSWMYNSNHSCELSMVLTGGAFFHKYYSYIYSDGMPEAIRSIVDKFMNCEDIAMNFLVAHLTRKPPIKVTSRWTFHCANCPSSLSEDESHFRERHECLNTFTSIYGYMPLLSTQHRSDSVLFKTRLPHDKQKCFKYV